MLAARLLLIRCLAPTAFLLLIAWEKANLGGTSYGRSILNGNLTRAPRRVTTTAAAAPGSTKGSYHGRQLSHRGKAAAPSARLRQTAPRWTYPGAAVSSATGLRRRQIPSDRRQNRWCDSLLRPFQGGSSCVCKRNAAATGGCTSSCRLSARSLIVASAGSGASGGCHS